MIMLPLISMMTDIQKAPGVLSMSNMLTRPYRLMLFYKHVNWSIVYRYVPMALIGSVLGAWSLSVINPQWLKILIALFLLSTPLQYQFGVKERSFPMKLDWFAPLGFVVSFLNSLIGAVGPVNNPFYLNYGVNRQELTATKTANSFIVGIVQLLSYWHFKLIGLDHLPLVAALTLGGWVGNHAGKYYLDKISEKFFRRLSIMMMTLSGLSMLGEGN